MDIFPFSHGKVEDISGNVSFDVVGDENNIIKELENMPQVMKINVTKMDHPNQESSKVNWHFVVIISGDHEKIYEVGEKIWRIDKIDDEKGNKFEVKDMIYSIY